MGDKPVSTNPLGQMRDEFMDSMGSTASQTAQAVVSEPKKILEAILGGSASSKSAEGSVEDLTQQAQQQTDDPQRQQQFVQKTMEEQQRTNELISFHREKLKEEKDYFEAKKQEAEAGKKQEERVEQQEQQDKIIQIERRSADIQKQAQLAGMLGSKEQGKQISG